MDLLGAIPVGESKFFFVPRTSHVNQFTFHKKWTCLRLNSKPQGAGRELLYEKFGNDHRKIWNPLKERILGVAQA